MSAFLKLIQLLPAIIQAVKAAEEFVPLPGQGKAKLEFILGLLSDAVEDIGNLIPAVTKIIARIVALANATGIFRKG